MKSRLGLVGLAAKLAPKVLSLLAKFAKTLKLGKLGLAGASFGAYAVLFSWQFALLILVSLLVHEYGHVWAMRRMGMKTRGVYLLPFVGAVAVADEAFPTRGAEAFIAMAGPAAGLLLAELAAGVYWFTGDPLWAAVAAWMALVNLFNLLPVIPLDGGRVLKAVACSLSPAIGLWLTAGVLLLTIIPAAVAGLGLIWFIAIVGGMDLLTEMRLARSGLQKPALSLGKGVLAAAFYLILGAALISLMFTMSHEPGAAIALEAIR